MIVGKMYKVTQGRSVMYGKFDYPQVNGVDRYLTPGIEDIETGTVTFYLESGQAVEFYWNSKQGTLVDSIEEEESN